MLPGGVGGGAEKCHLPSWDSPVRGNYGTASVSSNLDSNVVGRVPALVEEGKTNGKSISKIPAVS